MPKEKSSKQQSRPGYYIGKQPHPYNYGPREHPDPGAPDGIHYEARGHGRHQGGPLDAARALIFDDDDTITVALDQILVNLPPPIHFPLAPAAHALAAPVPTAHALAAPPPAAHVPNPGETTPTHPSQQTNPTNYVPGHHPGGIVDHEPVEGHDTPEYDIIRRQLS